MYNELDKYEKKISLQKLLKSVSNGLKKRAKEMNDFLDIYDLEICKKRKDITENETKRNSSFKSNNS